MAEPRELCTRLQEMSAAAGLPETPNPLLERHLGECDECRRLWAAELELRWAFSGVARPVLSPHFAQQLDQALAEDRRRQRKRRRMLRLMRVYWLAASTICASILLGLPWSAISGSWLALVAVSVVLPVLLVLRTCRVDLVDLILHTCDDQLLGEIPSSRT